MERVGESDVITTDYLVQGCGASAMAFVDVMLQETDARFIMVDRRPMPGGHWNDAYPFVTLHQPSSNYGVDSRELGHGRIDTDGFNKGMYELASGFQVADYFHQVMRDTFLPSGRVQFFPLSEIQQTENGYSIVNVLSSKLHSVQVMNKFVDATMLHTNIPLTHRRKFSVDETVTCVPPNDLMRLAPSFNHYTILGAGKTAIDCVLWLLENGADPNAITWVRPRDQWLLNRLNFQPGEQFLEQALEGLAGQYETSANAKSVKELCLDMEHRKIWLRIDKNTWPDMLHGATVTEMEIHQMQRVKNVIRLGHVKHISKNEIKLEKGAVDFIPKSLFIDCTARAISGNAESVKPVFAKNQINLQMIRQLQPTFSAALLGFIEATIENETEKASLSQVTPMTDSPDDWVQMMLISMSNQYAWTSNKKVAQWIANTRLDLYTKQVLNIDDGDKTKQALLKRMHESRVPAVVNLQKLVESIANKNA